MNNPNSRSLASRDPAICALLGVAAASAADYGSDFGAWGDDSDYGAWGADAAPPPAALAHRGHPMHPGHPGHPANMQAWQHHRMMATHARELELDPNKDSEIKVEGYDFSIPLGVVGGGTQTLGTASSLTATLQPSVSIKPKRMMWNSPAPGFVLISQVQVSNVNALVGGVSDSFNYSAQAQGSISRLPLVTPSLRTTVGASYTGLVPPGYVGATPYQSICTLQGPAILTGEHRG